MPPTPQYPPDSIETRRFRRRDDLERERLFVNPEDPRPLQPRGRSPADIVRDMQRQEALRAQRIAPQPPAQE